MPRQNRVTPFGALIATPERGTFLGNRGVLHDAAGRIRRSWQLQRWILCVLEFKGRRRRVMAPGRYTELFFLDEATGLAAGHRPCAECRRDRYEAFRRSWPSGCLPATELDRELHGERLNPDGTKRTFAAQVDDLPDGVLVTLGAADGAAYLLWNGQLLRWSPAGYCEPRAQPRKAPVSVLTPRSSVAAIRAGYVPEVHASAGVVSATERRRRKR